MQNMKEQREKTKDLMPLLTSGWMSTPLSHEQTDYRKYQCFDLLDIKLKKRRTASRGSVVHDVYIAFRGA
jgi:hypothetical protein